MQRDAIHLLDDAPYERILECVMAAKADVIVIGNRAVPKRKAQSAGISSPKTYLAPGRTKIGVYTTLRTMGRVRQVGPP